MSLRAPSRWCATFRPARLIIVSNPAFQTVCVGHYAPKWYGSEVGCMIPGVFSLHLALV